MTMAFQKAAVFTDIHFGCRSNSDTHNNDCLDFIDWFIKEADEFGAETCIFLGDFFHNRSTINVNTLNYGIEGLTRLAEYFTNVYFVVGNHDMFFKDKRDVTSARFGQLLEKVTVVQHPLVIGDTRFQPWMIGDEWKSIPEWQEKYVFGHFEIPGFLLNAMIECQDHGTVNKNLFTNQEYVFTGHFHKRQRSGNIHYIGNAFPHNYADAWDFERGCMLIEHGGKPIYRDWENCPKYITTNLSDIIADPSKYLTPDVYARVTIDVDLSYEEMATIRDELERMFQVREMELRPKNLVDEMSNTALEVNFQTIDQIIEEGLLAVDSATIDNAILVEIWRSV
jgi:hypothetical protein